MTVAVLFLWVCSVHNVNNLWKMNKINLFVMVLLKTCFELLILYLLPEVSYFSLREHYQDGVQELTLVLVLHKTKALSTFWVILVL